MLLSKLSGDPRSDGVSPSNKDEYSKESSKIDLRKILVFFYIFAALSAFGVVLYCREVRIAAAVLLWALACSLVGAIFGFLFGIPKILQNQRPVIKEEESGTAEYRQQVNTNLTEISDWLTKIIVGLGLINLNTIPVYLSSAADILARSLNPAHADMNKAFSLALIVSYLILGFLYSYLSTRLFLQSAFSKADQEAATIFDIARNAADKVIATTEARINTLETKQEYILLASAQSEPETGNLNDERFRGPLEQLRKMADEYLSITAPILGERIRLKNKAATAMLNHVRASGIPKDLLFKEAEQNDNEGIILALANEYFKLP